MKNILIVMETPRRDLKTAAFLSFWLAKKYGYRPIMTTRKNELSGLVRFKPHMIVLPHVRYAQMSEFLHYARAQKTRIAILPSEGLPALESIIHKLVIGLPEFYPFVDLHLSWGDYVAEYCRRPGRISDASVVTTGCPRFDVYSRQFDAIVPGRTEFCGKYGLDPKNPILLWTANTAYANVTTPVEEFEKESMLPGHSVNFVMGESYDMKEVVRDHQRTYVDMVRLFKRHAEAHPNITHLVKPHPQEPSQPYRDELKGHANVRVLDASAPLEELFRFKDVLLSGRCTTFLESWLTDIRSKTISFESPDNQSEIMKDTTVGSDIITGYEEFKEKVSWYLSGGQPSEELIDRRKRYLQKCIYTSDRSAGELCADTIDEHLRNKPEPRWAWRNTGSLLRLLRRQVSAGGWISQKRGPDHPKYFDPREIDQWIVRLNRLFQGDISSDRYEVFV